MAMHTRLLVRNASFWAIATAFLGSCVSISSAHGIQPQEGTEIEFRVVENKELTPSSIVATRNGKETVVVAEGEFFCVYLGGELDFDQNGLVDALAGTGACGASCCASQYFLVLSQDDGSFRRTEFFGSSWKKPIIEPWKGKPSIRILTQPAGMDTNPSIRSVHRYVVQNGEVNEVEKSVAKPVPAIWEFNSFEFETRNQIRPYVQHYDLNSDGADDQISFDLWERWGALTTTVQISGLPPQRIRGACKRIGILESQNNQFHDIVCNIDTLLSWKGKKYEVTSKFDWK